MPDAHVETALVREQGVPHTPQFVSVFKGASHPLDGLLSQFPKPELHEPNVQVPDEQSDIPCARLHVVPHPPQFESEFNGVSHPLDGLLSQFSQPELHDES